MPHANAARHVDRGSATPRLLDSCAAAVYAAAATPSRDLRRLVGRALLPSLPALLDQMLTIYRPPCRPPRGPRPSSLVAPAPCLFSARALSPSPSRAVVGSPGSITSPPRISLPATLSSALVQSSVDQRANWIFLMTSHSNCFFLRKSARAAYRNTPRPRPNPPRDLEWGCGALGAL